MLRQSFFKTILFVALACSACAQDSSNARAQAGPSTMAKGSRSFAKDALLFDGPGAWSAEVPAIEQILSKHGATYRTVSPSELNAMSLDDLSQFGAIIFPGGYGNQMADSLSAATQVRLRQAVRERGVNYVGFCAGSFIAVGATPADGQRAEYGLSIVDGPKLSYYYLEDEFVRQGRESEDWAMTMYSFADGSKRDVLWYGGPVTPDLPGHVVAKYPNGDAAISQLWSGNGLVMLSAGHPTVPTSVSASFGLNDSDGSDQELAWKLIDSAIHQRELPTF